jgi:Na+/H+-dicarboxylate symporter
LCAFLAEVKIIKIDFVFGEPPILCRLLSVRMDFLTLESMYKLLYVQVLLAILVGIAVGHFYPDLGVQLKPLGDAFIKLIKMVIAPLIFCSVVLGIAGVQNVQKIGRIGGKAMLYFQISTWGWRSSLSMYLLLEQEWASIPRA